MSNPLEGAVERAAYDFFELKRRKQELADLAQQTIAMHIPNEVHALEGAAHAIKTEANLILDKVLSAPLQFARIENNSDEAFIDKWKRDIDKLHFYGEENPIELPHTVTRQQAHRKGWRAAKTAVMQMAMDSGKSLPATIRGVAELKADLRKRKAMVELSDRAAKRARMAEGLDDSDYVRMDPPAPNTGADPTMRAAQMSVANASFLPAAQFRRGYGRRRVTRFRRRRYNRRRKSTTQYMRIKCGYVIPITTGTVLDESEGIFNYAIPIDRNNDLYWRLTGTVGGKTLTATTADSTIKMEPWYRLRPLFDWYRVRGIKLEYFPAFDTEAGDDTVTAAQQVQQAHPINVGYDMENDSADATVRDSFVRTLTNIGSYPERALIQRQGHKKMSMDSRWKYFVKISNPVRRFTNTSKGGRAGSWLSCDNTTASSQYGQVFIEQPVRLGPSGTLPLGLVNTVVGYLHVTKYIILKSIANDSGAPMTADGQA